MALVDVLWTILDSVSPFKAALVASLLLFYLVYLYLRDRRLPPGPIGLPFVGYWPFLKSETCHVQFKEMMSQYGDVMSFRVFGKLFIHLGSIKTIKEAHVTKGDCFASRCHDFNIMSEVFGNGFSLSNGEKWSVLRKFFLQKFKEFGKFSGKDNISIVLQDALKETVEELHSSQGQPIAITDLANGKCLSIIRLILFNDKKITMEEMTELQKEYERILLSFRSDVFLLYGNFVKYFMCPFKSEVRQMRRTQGRINSILMDVLKRHKKAYDEYQVDNVVDSYLKEREDRQRKGDPTAQYFTDSLLMCSLNQFVTDGVLTVGLFIGVFLLRLVEFPEEQQKIYEEIMDVVGPERLPTLGDRTKLPYTNAFIYEVMRLSDFFSFFSSLECSRDTEVQGFKIPKGALTTVNLYAAHRDPKIYEDPETFNPSRYLSTSKTRAELPILFGVGKRSCIGEYFTMTQTFLFVTTIVKIFRLEVPETEKWTSVSLNNPEKVKICAIARSQQ